MLFVIVSIGDAVFPQITPDSPHRAPHQHLSNARGHLHDRRIWTADTNCQTSQITVVWACKHVFFGSMV